MMLFVAMIIMLAPTLPLLFCSGRDTRAVGPVALCALTLALMGLPVAGILIAYAHFHPAPAALGLLAWGGALLVVVLAAYLSWRMLQIGVQLYLRKAVSDQMMLVDVHWIILAVWLGLLLSLSVGGISGAYRLLLVLLPFLLYKAVLHLALHPQRRAAAQAERPLRMLLLRVFGSPERSEELFEGVAHHWRHVGSIQLIAGTDLAAMTIEPHEAITFLSGHLADTFVTGPDDLARRWEARDLAPDPDGRFRVNEFFCHDDTWQSVLVRLLTDSDVVLMDLRGFTPLRQGCVFELHRLVDSVPLGRILLLVDHTTDVPFLARVLEVAWDNRTPDSPNGDTEAPLIPLRLFQLPPRPGTAESRQLVRLLASAATVPAHPVSLTT